MSEFVVDGSSPHARPAEPRRDIATLAELLVRPDRFFPKLVARCGERFPFLVIWIVGAGATIDRLDQRMAMSTLRHTLETDMPNPALTNWIATWSSVIVGGLIAGLLIWLIMGWWFRVRLIFCGARPTKRAARNVFIHARLIVGVTSLALLAVQTPFHGSFREAWGAAADPWGWIIAPLWSVWLSYRGVVSCFEVRPVAARVWFLILPVVVYGGLLAWMVTIGVG